MQNRKSSKSIKELSWVEVRNMLKWIGDVRSGDADNLEARADSYYWSNMFHDFKRDRDGDAPNNFLNYGYAILKLSLHVL